VYRVFEALDQLVTIVEEARGLPMTASCVVPRGDVLDLLDEIRDAVPAEMDDAQDVLDHKDRLIIDARSAADETVGKAQAEAQRLLADAHHESSSMIGMARAEADRLVHDATAQAEAILARAQADADRAIQAGQDQHDSLVERGRGEADRLVAAGHQNYEQAVAEGQAEQARLVGAAEVTQAARKQSAEIIGAAQDEADRLRDECDRYVDDRLAEFEEVLTKTLRTVGKGRSSLRSGQPATYAD
jgi:cell division septum initiation protein DivIVA